MYCYIDQPYTQSFHIGFVKAKPETLDQSRMTDEDGGITD